MVEDEPILAIVAPPGSRCKGYEDFVVQELRLAARVSRSRRQRWLTPDGRTLVAPLPVGVDGHVGPELRRFVLLQHHQGHFADRPTWQAHLAPCSVKPPAELPGVGMPSR